MKKILFVIIAALCYTGSIYAQNTENRKVIEVSATAQRSVTPDEIYLNITINEKDNKGKISVDLQEEQMIKALEGLGINTKQQLTVRNMGSTLQTYALKKDEIYASKDYTLKLSSASAAYAAINALNNLGIADIYLARTALSSKLQIEVKDSLLAEAARKAKKNAEIMANAVGSKSGKAIYLSNTYYFATYGQEEEIPFAIVTRKANTDNSSYKSEIRIKQENVSMNVNCKFELED